MILVVDDIQTDKVILRCAAEIIGSKIVRDILFNCLRTGTH